jgi:hypothetical protein
VEIITAVQTVAEIFAGAMEEDVLAGRHAAVPLLARLARAVFVRRRRLVQLLMDAALTVAETLAGAMEEDVLAGRHAVVLTGLARAVVHRSPVQFRLHAEFL